MSHHPIHEAKCRGGSVLVALILAVVACGVLGSCSRARPQLHIFIWPEYLDPGVIAEFEQKFNCHVTVDVFETIDLMLTKLAAGGSSAYDIVTTGQATVPVLSKRGLLAPLSARGLPNLRHIDPRFLNPTYDRSNRFSVPYQWGTCGLYVRKPRDRPIDETWGLLFAPEKSIGPFVLVEDIRFCFGAALQFQGHSLGSTNVTEISSARDLLLETKKRSNGFATSFGGKNRVLAKDATTCIAYSNDAINGEREDPETYYFIPREGGGLWVDTLSIPAHAPHRDLAEKFINFTLDPQIGARIANFNHGATPNAAALPWIDPKDRQHPGIYPPPEVMRRLELAGDLAEYNRIYEQTWTQIKSN